MAELKKWSVVGVVKGGKWLGIFTAATKEEAEAMALESDAASVRLCHQCSDECQDGEIDTAIAEPSDG